ncbi:MAG: hypothetical protein J0L93_07390 [Deltaproteobacteria bacterium]|nr:hypothetical protein [Deltaproteobacteria bacterium]
MNLKYFVSLTGLLAIQMTFAQNNGEVSTINRFGDIEKGRRYYLDPATRDLEANQGPINTYKQFVSKIKAAGAAATVDQGTAMADKMSTQLTPALLESLDSWVKKNKGLELNFENGTAYDRAHFIYSIYDSGKRGQKEIPKVDPNFPTIHVVMNAAQAKQRSDEFGKELEEFYKTSTDEYTKRFSENYTMDREFKLPIDKEYLDTFLRGRTFTGRIFIPAIATEMVDGKNYDVLKINIARYVRQNGKDVVKIFTEEELRKQYDFAGLRKQLVEILETENLSDDNIAELKDTIERIDQNKIVITPTYVLKPSPEVEDFKRLLASRSMTLNGFPKEGGGKTLAFQRGENSDHITLSATNVSPVLASTNSIVIVYRNGTTAEKASPVAMTLKDFEEAQYIAIPSEPETLRTMMSVYEARMAEKAKAPNAKKRSSIDSAKEILDLKILPKLAPECRNS